ncbi:aminoglycoside adenylyltransferase domain-containing protein [Ammoniphilus sp. YIM 78166]|uniref:aminoglycoside adenylyltransferase domain-containing protein n=1 Tax=Ammoniphilus sp. YIM 78166 TaxID=1644106 RepID=UPI00107061A9|nr:aminoglycoside adenylyltransferase domain-containing protein [Ammoniphilus sp. YIM 78166]
MIKQPQKLKAFLQQVGNDIESTFGDNHMSTILHGGIVLNEFTLHFSDIDLIVVLREASRKDVSLLIGLWNEWESKHPFGEKLWINLLGVKLLTANKGTAWTVSKKGLRTVQGMPIDGMELHTLLNHGKTLKGEHLIHRFPRLPKTYQADELGNFYRILETYSMTTPLQPYYHRERPTDDDIGIILTFPRFLYNLKTGKILTKCKAAQWYAERYKPFREELLTIAKFRLEPSTKDPQAILALYQKVPDMIPYFWTEYFRHFNLQISIPAPISLGTTILYQHTFTAIHSGLVRLSP